jgi:hypothetical protein
MSESDYQLSSTFIDKKLFKSNVKTIKPCVGQERVEAISFWKCMKDDEQISCGVNVFRKG